MGATHPSEVRANVDREGLMEVIGWRVLIRQLIIAAVNPFQCAGALPWLVLPNRRDVVSYQVFVPGSFSRTLGGYTVYRTSL
jgi:hypothetical protein